jgi:hypothetical protein
MENFLEKKKVHVKLVPKTRSGFSKISDGAMIYTGCKQTFQAPTNQYDRLIPILIEDEQRWLEERMGLNKGELAFNNKDKSYWKDFKVTLDKKGKTLDLMEYEDYLAYKVLLASKTVANSKDEINQLQHDFYMEDEFAVDQEDERASEKFENANKLFNKISKSDKQMKDVLRLLGVSIVADASTKWLKSKLVKIIENKNGTAVDPGIEDFIRTAADPEFEVKIFILDAIEIGEVRIEGTTYKLRSGDTVGFELGQAISFFNNPKNQQTRLLVEERIKTNK